MHCTAQHVGDGMTGRRGDQSRKSRLIGCVHTAVFPEQRPCGRGADLASSKSNRIEGFSDDIEDVPAVVVARRSSEWL